MAAATERTDELVREYLLFRGFTAALKQLDAEIKADREKGFRVSGSRGPFPVGRWAGRGTAGLRACLGAALLRRRRRAGLGAASPVRAGLEPGPRGTAAWSSEGGGLPLGIFVPVSLIDGVRGNGAKKRRRVFLLLCCRLVG